MMNKITSKIQAYRFLLTSIITVLLAATLMHGIYFNISIFHAFVLHPFFIIAILLLLLFSEQHSKKAKREKIKLTEKIN